MAHEAYLTEVGHHRPKVIYSTEDYAAILALAPDANKTIVTVGQLTGNITINVTATDCENGDELQLILSADGSNRTFTLGTALAGSAATLQVDADTSKLVTGVYNGTSFILDF